jgi:hypothetical protein
LLNEAAPSPDRKPKAVTYASFSKVGAAGTPVHFPSVVVDRTAIKTILQNVDLTVVPLVNPDGYRFSRVPGNEWWRKNRRFQGPLAPCVQVGLDMSLGTDINRNTDAAWNVETFYNPDFYNTGKVKTAKDACGTAVTDSTGATFTVPGETYRGQSVFSEPETRRVKALIDSIAPIFYVDVHSYGPTVLFGWGTANMQGTSVPPRSGDPDDTQNFKNVTVWDFHRDGGTGVSGHGHVYEEFVPPSLLGKLRTVGKRMGEGIKKMSAADPSAATDPLLTSKYEVKPSIDLYAATGTLPDYLMEANYGPITGTAPFRITTVSPQRFPFTIECGSREQGIFQPAVATEYLKIEREVHLALWSLLAFAASPIRAATASWPLKTGS